METLIWFLSSGDPVLALMGGVAVTLLLLLIVTLWIACEIAIQIHHTKQAKRSRDRFRF
jgi:hypothetical protein